MEIAFGIENNLDSPFKYQLGGALPFLHKKSMRVADNAFFGKPYSLLIDFFSIKFRVENYASDIRILLVNHDVFEINATHLGTSSTIELRFDSTHDNLEVFVDNVSIFGKESNGLINYSAPIIDITGACEISQIVFGNTDFTDFTNDSSQIYAHGDTLFFAGFTFSEINEKLVEVYNETAIHRLTEALNVPIHGFRVLADSWLDIIETFVLVEHFFLGKFVKSYRYKFEINPKQKQVCADLFFENLNHNSHTKISLIVPKNSSIQVLMF